MNWMGEMSAAAKREAWVQKLSEKSKVRSEK
jgi:hypothetical protein